MLDLEDSVAEASRESALSKVDAFPASSHGCDQRLGAGERRQRSTSHCRRIGQTPQPRRLRGPEVREAGAMCGHAFGYHRRFQEAIQGSRSYCRRHDHVGPTAGSACKGGRPGRRLHAKQCGPAEIRRWPGRTVFPLAMRRLSLRIETNSTDEAPSLALAATRSSP